MFLHHHFPRRRRLWLRSGTIKLGSFWADRQPTTAPPSSSWSVKITFQSSCFRFYRGIYLMVCVGTLTFQYMVHYRRVILIALRFNFPYMPSLHYCCTTCEWCPFILHPHSRLGEAHEFFDELSAGLDIVLVKMFHQIDVRLLCSLEQVVEIRLLIQRLVTRSGTK